MLPRFNHTIDQVRKRTEGTTKEFETSYEISLFERYGMEPLKEEKAPQKPRTEYEKSLVDRYGSKAEPKTTAKTEPSKPMSAYEQSLIDRYKNKANPQTDTEDDNLHMQRYRKREPRTEKQAASYECSLERG